MNSYTVSTELRNLAMAIADNLELWMPDEKTVVVPTSVRLPDSDLLKALEALGAVRRAS